MNKKQWNTFGYGFIISSFLYNYISISKSKTAILMIGINDIAPFTWKISSEMFFALFNIFFIIGVICIICGFLEKKEKKK